ncbi:MAG: VOC family protein [Candidatus Solibacter sp.]
MPGQIGWLDLTVADAPALRDFYSRVVGWTPSPVDMKGYQDYCMHPPGEAAPVAGICHARAQNTGLPPVWLVYITVADLEESLRHCQDLGGAILRPATGAGPSGRFAVIQDPAGAVCALFEAAAPVPAAS